LEYTDIFVRGELQQVQQAVQRVFSQGGFKIEWQGPFAGKAKRGSKTGQIIGGALVEYLEFDFQIFQTPDGTVVVRIIKASSGWWGGYLRVRQAKRKHQEIVNMLSNYFYSIGTFLGRQDGRL
jgi:hypothetical protein